MTFRCEVGVAAVGLVGPGLPDWARGRAALAEIEPYVTARTVLPMPSVLSASDRRRAGRVLRVAVGAASEAAGVDAAHLATVFTSSAADGDNCHELCLALATNERAVSPTRFMNSVHNAAAGYFSLATHSMRPTTSLCAHDASFSAGLLEAAIQVRSTGDPVLLVAYDADYPAPLRDVRPIPDTFAVALRLTQPEAAGVFATLTLRLVDEPATRLDDAALEALRHSIPAARALPLLALLARESTGDCVLDYLEPSQLGVSVHR
ncbi:MAG: beta-ketoacyl synthase chain length factor [Steroidobacteraceae bacterium]